MTDTAHVSSKMTNGICEFVLDNPGRKNALSYALLDDLNNAIAAAADEARAIILSGAGNVFSAGADFADLNGTIDDIAIDDAIEKAVVQIREFPAPVFAAVEGPCMGGAVDIALACDFLLASETAFFEVPAARLGLLYNPEAVRRWHDRISGQTLRRMLLLGDRFTAAEARQAGIVSHIAAPGGALKKSRELAGLAANCSRDVIAATKGMLAVLETGETDLAHWEQVRRKILASPERRELISGLKAATDN